MDVVQLCVLQLDLQATETAAKGLLPYKSTVLCVFNLERVVDVRVAASSAFKTVNNGVSGQSMMAFLYLNLTTSSTTRLSSIDVLMTFHAFSKSGSRFLLYSFLPPSDISNGSASFATTPPKPMLAGVAFVGSAFGTYFVRFLPEVRIFFGGGWVPGRPLERSLATAPFLFPLPLVIFLPTPCKIHHFKYKISRF